MVLKPRIVVLKPQRRRHPEAPRFHQRGEGSRADCSGSDHIVQTLHARSLARLKNAALRDDALNEAAR